VSEEEVSHQPDEDGFDAVAAVAAARVAHDEALANHEAGADRLTQRARESATSRSAALLRRNELL
jgi:hypothetical protein